MDSIAVGDYLLNLIRLGSLDLLTDKGQGLVDSIHTFLSSALLFSILVYGVRIMAGDLAGSGKELALTSIFVVLAISITTPNIYYDFIIKPVIETRDNLSVFIVNFKYNQSLFESIGASFYRMFGHGKALIDSGSIMSGNITPILAGIAVFVIYGIYYTLIVANLLFCELVVFTLFLLGLLIIPVGAFKTARGCLKGWVIALVKYNFVFIIVCMIISIVNAINEPIINKMLVESYQNGEIKEGLLNPNFGMVLIMGCFGAYLMSKSMEVAAELTGTTATDGAIGAKSLANTVTSSVKGMGAVSNGGGSALRALKAKISS